MSALLLSFANCCFFLNSHTCGLGRRPQAGLAHLELQHDRTCEASDTRLFGSDEKRMGCIKRAMMFEAQMTEFSMISGEKKEKRKRRRRKK